MALKTREAFFNLSTGIRTNLLFPTAKLVSRATRMPIPRNKAIIGENAFPNSSAASLRCSRVRLSAA
jgi:2-isopropylmalate synthase